MRATVQEKLAVLDAWHLAAVSGGTNQKKFCEAHGLNRRTFHKWIGLEARLRETSVAKKNSQRAGIHDEAAAELRVFIDRHVLAYQQVTVPDMLAFAERERLLRRTKKYLARYMLCRRVLFDYVMSNPLPSIPALIAEEDDHEDDHEDVEEEDEGVPGNAGFIYVNRVVYFDPSVKRTRMNLGRCTCVGDCIDSCINRACAEECDKRNCSLRGRCSNRWVGKTVERRFQTFETETMGWGLRACGVLPVGSVVLQYCGEYMSKTTYGERRRDLPDSTPSYFMECDPMYGVDARVHGNLARFINHSCLPNLNTVKRVVDGLVQVFLVTAREIRAHEEVTFSYGPWMNFVCRCVVCQEE